MADTDVVETWVNTGRGRVKVHRHDGKERIREVITGGKRFDVTPAERRRMQAAVATDVQDPFRNGTFALVGSTGEVEQSLLNNPNALSDSDIDKLWGQTLPKFEQKVAEVTNVVTARRIRELGEEHDKANPRKMAVIADRIAELSPTDVNEVTHIGPNGTAGKGDPQPLPDMTVPQGLGGTAVGN